MGKLLQLGVDPKTLYAQFRERSEQREERQEGTQRNAQARLTENATTVREYRAAREAEESLIVEPDLSLDEMSFSDYKKVRRAERRGERPVSYREYRSFVRTATADNEPSPENAEPETDPTECDLAAHREEREQEG